MASVYYQRLCFLKLNNIQIRLNEQKLQEISTHQPLRIVNDFLGLQIPLVTHQLIINVTSSFNKAKHLVSGENMQNPINDNVFKTFAGFKTWPLEQKNDLDLEGQLLRHKHIYALVLLRYGLYKNLYKIRTYFFILIRVLLHVFQGSGQVWLACYMSVLIKN